MEIVPGELIEYQQIIKQKDVTYAIVDVSDLFINNCLSKFPNVRCFQMPMEAINNEKTGIHDVVYVASVLEHSKDIKLALCNLLHVARRFHFVMFKWNYGGNLTAEYRKRKKYWSTSFNIHQLLQEIKQLGTIESCIVAKQGGGIIDFKKFSRGRKGKCRTGDYLVISGQSNMVDSNEDIDCND